MSQKPIIGAHVSAAGGLPNAVLLAHHIGAGAIQLFGSSPRQWAASVPLAKEAADFRAAVKREGLSAVFLHAPYLINLATSNVPLWKKSVALMTTQMKIAEAIGARGVIVHVGSGSPSQILRHKTWEGNGGRQGDLFQAQSFDRAVAGIKQVLRNAPGKSLFIIENNAGGGERVGKDLAEIALLTKKVGSVRTAFCLDTAHAFEAGIAEYSAPGVKKLAKEIVETVGWKRLIAIHANDSKTVFGSNHDRHENIGKGYIGEEGFKNLLAHPDFRKVPFILEVPGFAGEGPDKKNVEILKRLA